MAEITTHAYQDLRDHIQTNWQYIELQDDTGNPIVRLSPSDERVTWTHDTNASTLSLQAVIKGSDTDITYPVTFVKSAIYDVATGGEAYSEEEFTPFTIEGDEDEITIIHNIEVPQVI